MISLYAFIITQEPQLHAFKTVTGLRLAMLYDGDNSFHIVESNLWDINANGMRRKCAFIWKQICI